MQNYIIVTDSGSDLTKEWAKEIDVKVIDLAVSIEGAEPVADSKIDPKELYAMLRDKKSASTSAINIEDFTRAATPFLEEGKDILYLGFSSGLSSTYSSGHIAAEELSEKYPDRKIYTVDTLCASLGQGLLVYLAAQLRANGASIEEVRDFAESNKLNLCHWFTVDDLVYLKRGGRVSPTVAFVGGLLGIKPIMHVDNEGHLIKVGTVRGRKAALKAIVEKYGETALDKNGKIFISHGDCIDDANEVADMIKETYGTEVELITDVGAVIGSHSGPGTFAFFYLGKER